MKKRILAVRLLLSAGTATAIAFFVWLAASSMGEAKDFRMEAGVMLPVVVIASLYAWGLIQGIRFSNNTDYESLELRNYVAYFIGGLINPIFILLPT